MLDRPADDRSLDDRPLGERLRDTAIIENALGRAVRDALKRHKQAGQPVAVWRDGQVVWVAPEDIEVSAEG